MGLDISKFPPVDMAKVAEYEATVAARVLEEREKYNLEEVLSDEAPPEIDSRDVQDALKANELGDGTLYKLANANELLFCKAMDSWLTWRGHHWAVDKLGDAQAAVERVVELYLDEAAEFDDKASEKGIEEDSRKWLQRQAKALRDRASRLRSRSRRNNCLDFAHNTTDPLAIKGDELDAQPWMLPCANGVLDLRSGELYGGRRDDYLLKSCPVEWAGWNAPCSLWESSLLEIFNGDQQLVDFFQRLCGFALIGRVLQSVIVVMTGRGRNGKSLVVEVLAEILGPLAGAIRSEMLLDQTRNASSAGPTPDIMALRGLRMAFASETDDGCKISASRVKWITGDDTLTGRNPHDKYEIQFKPSHTLFLLTNHVPAAPGDDFAFWQRVILIPFDLSFVNRDPVGDYERRADTRLKDKLLEELPGILAWMVRGCLTYQLMGLQPPAKVLEATRGYQQDEDVMGKFIDDCCLTDDRDVITPVKELRAAFEGWWEREVSDKVPSPKWFGKHLGRRFKKVKKGTYHYQGVRLNLDLLDLFDQRSS